VRARGPQRICDVALEAIPRLLDEEPRRAGLGRDPAGVAATRDRWIEQLRERLAKPK